jgi:SAM-dependent methyltransferase
MSASANYYDANYRRWLPDDRQAAILDIGCGQGDFVRYVHGLGYRNLTAVDLDAQAVTALKDLDGVTALETDIRDDLPSTLNGPWSVIVAKQVIYYVDRGQAPALLRSLAAALEPDGRLVIEIFNGALLSSRFTQAKDPGILTAYSELGLERLLAITGLKVECMHGAIIRGSLLYRIARSAWHRLYRLLLILDRGRDEELPRVWSKSIIAVARKT